MKIFNWVLVGLSLAAPAMAAPPKPKLVVAISVDQFADSLFQQYRGGFTGGLKRLSDGVVFLGYQSHAATETCPGHSTILTGDHPARTGIVANTWFDRKTGSSIYCVSVPNVGDLAARGPQNLRVDTLGDWLKRAEPGARSVAVSGKDRAAITMGGHHADAVYWWADRDGFTTSAHAGPATPAVLAPAKAFNTAQFAAWRKAPPRLWPAATGVCAALQKPYRYGDLELSGAVPPEASLHVEDSPSFPITAAFQDALRASPSFDPMTLDFATKVLDADHLGRGPATDLLAVSLSSTDFVGHRYGNGGAEQCVQLQTLDRALGLFFDHLDSLHIPYVVVLTADHGAPDAPERAGPPASRIDGRRVIIDLNRYLQKTLALGYEPIVGDDPRQLSINLASEDPAARAKVRDLAVAWLNGRPEVSHAFSAEEIIAAAPPKGKPMTELTLAERFHESFDPDRSGDIQVAFVEGATVGIPQGPGDNIGGHGSPWDYDRRVPILFWWPGVTAKAGGRPIETVDIAPTLAAVAGIPAPPVDGVCVDLGQGCPGR